MKKLTKVIDILVFIYLILVFVVVPNYYYFVGFDFFFEQYIGVKASLTSIFWYVAFAASFYFDIIFLILLKFCNIPTINKITDKRIFI